MNITIKLLEAKRQELTEAVENYKGLLNANAGALQVIDELLAVAKAPEPKAAEATKEK